MSKISDKKDAIALLKELNKLTHDGKSIGNEIEIKYFYVNKKYNSVSYKVNATNDVVLYNEDYDIIYVVNSTDKVFKALNELQTGKFY